MVTASIGGQGTVGSAMEGRRRKVYAGKEAPQGEAGQGKVKQRKARVRRPKSSKAVHEEEQQDSAGLGSESQDRAKVARQGMARSSKAR